jgi:redox-sensitive bicupin YhaK (pirin superfamily)
LLQIWIEPAQRGTAASYEQQVLALEPGTWRLIASPDGAHGSTTIGQDARILATLLGAGEAISHRLAKGRLAYVQLTYGQLDLNGKKLSAGDGAKIANESELHFLAGEETEFLLFDLPPQV